MDPRKQLHLRIWGPGVLAAVIFVFFNWLMTPDFSLREGILLFVVFYAVWVVLHYIMLRKKFKEFS